MEKDSIDIQYFWDDYCKEIHPTWRTPISQLVFNEGFRRGMKFIYNELMKRENSNIKSIENNSDILYTNNE